MGALSSTYQKEQQCLENLPVHWKTYSVYNKLPDQKPVVYHGSNHFKTMFTKLNDMRKSGTLTDVIIRCSKQDFHCHSIVLAVRSTFFQNYFASQSKDHESAFTTFHENEMKLDVLEKLLEYIYVGSISIPKHRIEEYLDGAKRWNLYCICTSPTIVLNRYSNHNALVDTQAFTDEDFYSHCFNNKQPDFESSIESKLKKYFYFWLDGMDGCSPVWNITLTTSDNKKIMCHRELLASFSEYFYAMFCSSSFSESFQQDVFLQDVDQTTLSCILEYVYASQITFDYNNLIAITVATRWLMVEEELLNAAQNRLAKTITYKNCMEMYNLSIAHSLPLLQKEAIVPLFGRLQSVMWTDEFQQLSLKDLCEYLSSDSLTVMSEKMVFEAVLRWSEHHNPEDSCVALTKCVRLPLLSCNDLKSCICKLSSKEKTYYGSLLSQFLEAEKRVDRLPLEVVLQNAGSRLRNCFEKVHLTVVTYRDLDTPVLLLVVLRVKPARGEQKYDSPTTEPQFCLEYFCKFRTEFDLFRQFCVATFNNQLYITGGIYKLAHSPLYNPTRPSATTLIFNPRVPHKWSQGGDLQVARYMHHMVLVGDSLYVLGGKNQKHEFECQVEKLQLSGNKWMKETMIPNAEENMVCCAWKEQICVVSRVEGNNALVLCRYSTTRRHWLPALALSTSEIALGTFYTELWDLIVIKENIYLFETSCWKYTMVSVFDPLTERWQSNIQNDAPLSYVKPFLQDDVTLVALGNFALKSYFLWSIRKCTEPCQGTCLWTPTANTETRRHWNRLSSSATNCKYTSTKKPIQVRHPMCPVYIYSDQYATDDE